ncbi:MAG: creatininase family protein [Candidatus Bathyarchaeia archaeon]
MSSIVKVFYADLTWEEVKQAASENMVVVLPVGSTEQHGPHLPVKTDWLCVSEVARMAVDKVRGHALVMPTIYYGFQEHTLDFPGTISVRDEHFVNYVYDICRSVAHHGFKKMILINGHGSNMPFLDAVMRRVNNYHPNVMCALVAWWDLVFRVGPKAEEMKRLRQSEFPGGMSHACELETSAMLHLDPQLVDMSKAVKEVARKTSEFTWGDIMIGAWYSPVHTVSLTSRGSKTGVFGDPTVATAAKGKAWLEAAAENLARFILEWQDRPIPPRVDHH